MTQSIEDETTINILEDIATLARKLAEKEPFKSASGPEALQAFATHIDRMATDLNRASIVNVDVRSRRKA